jgi:UDP-N-acetylglucosamine--N-acetylmuramyl-(pentapeptide) pyrophosphoryl-undecaprenol N-acetylglucosamine transferase
MRLVIAGGGTGGHLFPGLAIAEEFVSRDPQNQVLFMGAHGGLEERLVPLHGHRLELLPSLKGGLLGLQVARKTMHACQGYMQARKLILEFGAQAVVGLGGYASALPVLVAWGIEVPCLMLEQNVIPGKVTRQLSAFADEVGVQFLQSGRHLHCSRKIKHVGNPLRRNVVDASLKATRRNLETRAIPGEPVLLVLGGSQGARFLNELTVQLWPKVKKVVPNLRVLLVAGRDDGTRASEAFAAAGVRGKVVSFTEAMEDLYLQADVVLARAGATTMAELAAFALPSVLVPYPHAADDHQTANARVFQEAGAAWTFPQARLDQERLARRIADTVLQPERRRRMAAAAASLARPYAAAEVVDRLERLAGVRAAATPPHATPPATPDAVHASVA